MTLIHQADPEDPGVAGAIDATTAILARIVDQSQERIAVIDPNFRLIFVSRALREDFERWFGVSVEPGADLRAALAARPDQAELALECWSRALAGESFTVVDRKSTRLNSSHVKIS